MRFFFKGIFGVLYGKDLLESLKELGIKLKKQEILKLEFHYQMLQNLYKQECKI